MGGGIKKIKKSQQQTETKNNKIFIHYEDMNFYGLLEHVKKLKKDDDTNNNYRIIITKKGLCNTIFYDEIEQKNIHNGRLKISSKGNQVMQFEMDNIIIDENGDYQDVESAINEFNKTIKKEEHKYIYRGQTPHGLAYEYYTNNYDKQNFK